MRFGTRDYSLESVEGIVMKGFIFSIDALFAVIVFLLAAVFLYSNIPSFNTSNSIADQLRQESTDKTITEFYLGATGGNDVDLIFILDTSTSTESLWRQSPTICDRISDLVSALNQRGANVSTKLYALSTTIFTITNASCYQSATKIGQSELRSFIPSGENQSQWYVESNCTPSGAVTTHDTVCEAWGSGTGYAIENAVDSSFFRPSAKKFAIVLADNDPSGGLSNNDSDGGFEGFRKGLGNSCGLDGSADISCTQSSSEMALNETLIQTAFDSDVRLLFLRKTDCESRWNLQDCFEYTHRKYFSTSENKNDAIALLERAASQTNGFVEEVSFANSQTVYDKIFNTLIIEVGTIDPSAQFGYCFGYYYLGTTASGEVSVFKQCISRSSQ